MIWGLTKQKKIIFKRKKQCINFNYRMNGVHILDTNSIKNLGVILDSKLIFYSNEQGQSNDRTCKKKH